MKAEPRTVWIGIGAVVGGLLAGSFDLDPGWLWGMGGGILGGALGALAAFLAARPWPGWVRLPFAAGTFLGGLVLMWLLLSFAKTTLMFVEVAQPQ